MGEYLQEAVLPVQYDNYVFDLYGTLVDIHTEEDFPKLWEKLALFFGYYGAIYEPKELQKRYAALVSDCERALKKTLEEDRHYTHEASPEIEIGEVFEKLSGMYGKGLIGHDPFFLIQFFKHFPDLNLRRCLMRIMPVLFQRLFQRALTVADKCRIALLQFLRFINSPVISKKQCQFLPQFWKIFLCVDIHQCPVQIKHIIVVLHRQHGFLQIFSHVNFSLL